MLFHRLTVQHFFYFLYSLSRAVVAKPKGGAGVQYFDSRNYFHAFANLYNLLNEDIL